MFARTLHLSSHTKTPMKSRVPGVAAQPPFSSHFLAICWKLGKSGDVLNRLDARDEMRGYPRIPVSGGPQSVQ